MVVILLILAYVIILLSLADEIMDSFMLYRERMATIAGASGAAAPSSVVAVGAPLVSLPFLEVMELFPVWTPWRRLNNPCAFWALGRLGA